MLSKSNFKIDYIRTLQTKYGRDPALLERVLFAFGLVEALIQVELPFIFKGGTCLMLLLESPERLSTDIDIIVNPGTDIESYIRKASIIFPFISYEEQVRIGKNNIEKRHFKFLYDSPLSGKRFYILLDAIFAQSPYTQVVSKEVKNAFLHIEEPKLFVTVPTVESILGEKLTAFAPHTTGIPFGTGRELEIIKQLYDVAVLFDVMEKQEIVSSTYNNAVMEELSYRGLELQKKDVLSDTINASVCIASRGNPNKQDYAEYLRGIKAIGNHILTTKYSGEIAAHQACKVMYLAACLLTGVEFKRITAPDDYITQSISNDKYSRLSSIRKQKPEAYGYLVEAVKLLENGIDCNTTAKYSANAAL